MHFLKDIIISYIENKGGEMMTQKPYGTVLLKAATILDYLAEAPSKPLQEISEATKLTPSTALKILETLQMIGYVKRDKEKNYRLGSKLIKYANQNIQELDLVEISLPYLKHCRKRRMKRST